MKLINDKWLIVLVLGIICHAASARDAPSLNREFPCIDQKVRQDGTTFTNNCSVPVEVLYCFEHLPPDPVGDVHASCSNDGVRTTGTLARGATVTVLQNLTIPQTADGMRQAIVYANFCDMSNPQAYCRITQDNPLPSANGGAYKRLKLAESKKLEQENAPFTALSSEPDRSKASSASKSSIQKTKTATGSCPSFVVFPAVTVYTGEKGSFRAVVEPARFEVNLAVANDPAELSRRTKAFQEYYEDNETWDIDNINVIEDVPAKQSMYIDPMGDINYKVPEIYSEKHAAEPGLAAMSIKPFLDNARCWLGLTAASNRVTQPDDKSWDSFPVVKNTKACLKKDKNSPRTVVNTCKKPIEVFYCFENDEPTGCAALGRRAEEERRKGGDPVKGGFGIVTSQRLPPGHAIIEGDQYAACPWGATIAVKFSLSHEEFRFKCIMVPGHGE